MTAMDLLPDDTLGAVTPTRRSAVPWRLVLGTAGCLAAAALWIGSAIATAGTGFNTTDEAFYLLSYRWWNLNWHNFTGAQLIYGPIFALLDHRIVGLRLVRVVTLVASHATFGWAFMSWLRPQRPTAPHSRWWEAVGVAAILAGGGAIYGWLPPSPGYNDVMLCGLLLSVATVLRTEVRRVASGVVPAWHGLLLGPPAVAMAVAKWGASVAVLPLLAALAATMLYRAALRERLRYLAAVLAGVLATAAVLHLLVTPLPPMLAGLRASNALIVAGQPHYVTDMLGKQAHSGIRVLAAVLRTYWPLLGALPLLMLARTRRTVILAAGATVAGGGWALLTTLDRHRLDAGVANVGDYIVVPVMLAVAGLACAAALWWRQRRLPRDHPALAMLLILQLLPFGLAVGSLVGTPAALAVNGYALWIAGLIALCAGARVGRTARAALTVLTASAVLLAGWLGYSGPVLHPYRMAPLAQATTEVQAVPALRGITLSPAAAAAYGGLRRDLAPWLSPPGRAVIAFYGMAAITFAIDGRPVGELWSGTSADGQRRALASVRAECAGGRPWWGLRRPLVFIRGKATPLQQATLASCGIDLASYRRVRTPGLAPDIGLYVPKQP